MTSTTLTAPQLLTLNQVAAAMQCNRRTIERLVACGALPVVHIGRNVRVVPRDLEVFIDSRRETIA